MDDSRAKAKQDLIHCFCRCWPGEGDVWTQSNVDKIEGIVDLIIEAAIDEVKSKFKKAMEDSGALFSFFGGGSGYAIAESFVKNEDKPGQNE